VEWCEDRQINEWRGAQDCSVNDKEMDFLRNCARCNAVLSKPLVCARCDMVRYCSRDCQRAAWRCGHKDSCGSFYISPFLVEATPHAMLPPVVHEYAPGHPALAYALLNELSDRMYHHADNSQQLMDAGAMAAVVGVLTLHVHDPFVARIACIFIRNATAQSDARSRDIRKFYSLSDLGNSHTGRQRAEDAGAAAAVCAALQAHTASTEIQFEGFCCLAHMCMGPNWTLQKMVVTDGGIPLCLAAVQHGSVNEQNGFSVTGVAACALQNMLNSDRPTLREPAFLSVVRHQLLEHSSVRALAISLQRDSLPSCTFDYLCDALGYVLQRLTDATLSQRRVKENCEALSMLHDVAMANRGVSTSLPRLARDAAAFMDAHQYT